MEHPLNGAWTLTMSGSNRPGPGYATVSFHPEGSMSITITGYTAHGAWLQRGPKEARFRALAPLAPGEAQTGWHTLTFDVRVQENENHVSLEGDYARPTPSGTPRVTALSGVGERIAVE